MRILFCISTLGIGGVERHVIDQIPYFRTIDPGIELALCSFRPGAFAGEARKKIADAGAELFVLNRRKRFDVGFVRSFRQVVRNWQPDIIHAYNFGASFWARMALQGIAPRMVCHYGGIAQCIHWYSKLIEKFLLKRTDVFIFNSHAVLKVFENVFKMPRYRVIHNGLETRGYSEPVLNIHPFDGKRPFELLSLGRVTPIKACDIQLQAVHELQKRGRQVKLTLVGDGESLEAMKALAKKLNIEDIVKFEGYQLDVARYYRNTDLFLVTSYHETFCLTLCEAMLHGLVSISADVGGPTEILRHGENGFLVPGEDELAPDIKPGWRPMIYHGHKGELGPPLAIRPGRLADQIEQVMDQFNALNELRREAYRTVMENFSMQKHCTSLINLYHELLDGKKCKEA